MKQFDLKRLIAKVERPWVSFAALRADLVQRDGAVFAGGGGQYTCTISGIAGSSDMGEEAALADWARAARRATLVENPRYLVIPAEDEDLSRASLRTFGSWADLTEGTPYQVFVLRDPVRIVPGDVPEPDAPTNLTAPSISGTPTVGQALTATEGTWTGGPIVTLQWLRNGAAISGATGLTYLLIAADAGANISVRATASNAGGSATSTSTAVGPVTESSQPIAPISGILDAAHINVFGASFSKYAEADYAAVAAQFGFTGTVHMYAVAGLQSTGFPAQLAAAVDANTVADSLSIVDFGGNDVTSNRPYPGGGTGLDSRMRTNIDALIAGGSKPLIVPISFRYYTSGAVTATGTVWDWTIANEDNGSKPYNENVMYPLLAEYNPDWVRPDGVPFLDAYNWTKGNQYFVCNDGVHPHAPDTFTASILSKAAVRASGQDPEDKSRLYGKTILYAPRRNSGGGWSMYGGIAGEIHYNGVVPLANTATEQNTQRDHMVFGGLCTDGTIASTGLVRVTHDGTLAHGTAAFNAGRLPDADIAAVQEVASANAYVGAGSSFLVQFFDYPAGRTVDVTVAGQTNSADRPQTVTFSTGQTATFDAGNTGETNLVTVSVVVPANGQFSFTLSGGATPAVLSTVKAHIN
ncbi:SGNH/GDSL hydrolase family protein [Sinirhodobacter populi]|uniref:SGNH/GDSL hydrolase family protein n=1 Tax=Paenirhodobacter populi TaxID=2306993 RepID=A0A443KQ03_9RHOB|nr:SGNH/GDSL hydrolase family protein [Sinirhodobacter populi]RWR35010.1 SGNH/GDSL hydrolase family protein [Sinirhodobacter populi]